MVEKCTHSSDNLTANAALT